jgi:acyl carrier protein
MSLAKFIGLMEQELQSGQAITIDPDKNLREAIVWSSMNAVLLITLITAEYGVQLKNEDLQRAETARDLYEKHIAPVENP